MKGFLFALALAAPFVMGAAPQDAKITAQDVAQGMQPVVGQEFGGGITIDSVTAEGNTLVLTVTGPDGWSAGMGPQDISTALLGGFCSEAPQFFDSGITMRVDSLESGKRTKGPVETRCPAQ